MMIRNQLVCVLLVVGIFRCLAVLPEMPAHYMGQAENRLASKYCVFSQAMSLKILGSLWD